MSGTYIEIPSSGGTGSGGNVTGPTSSTDNAIARFDSTTGKLLQNSSVTINDSGVLSVTDIDLGVAGIFGARFELNSVIDQNTLEIGSTDGSSIFNIHGFSEVDFNDASAYFANSVVYADGSASFGNGAIGLYSDGSAQFGSGAIGIGTTGSLVELLDNGSGSGSVNVNGPAGSISMRGPGYFGAGTVIIGSSSVVPAWIDTNGSVSFASGQFTIDASGEIDPHGHSIGMGGGDLNNVGTLNVSTITIADGYISIAQGASLVKSLNTQGGGSGGVLYVDSTVGATDAEGKLAFFGVTPALRQTGGSATAGATYTATEQAMLQKVYDCLRTFGLLT